MTIVMTDDKGVTHLRGHGAQSLCREFVSAEPGHGGVLTCPDCARTAMRAIELSTKAERREWRKL